MGAHVVNILKDRRGIAMIYVAISLVVLVALTGIAVDIAYMYVVKGQLQNAADAASIAATSKLDGTNSTYQSAARDEAVRLAQSNQAGGKPVLVANDFTNVLSSTNDITVGYWDGTTFTPSVGTTLVNAVQVRTRRTADSPGGTVSIFLGRVLGWNTMSAISTATAARPVRASIDLAFCLPFCSAAGSRLIMQTGDTNGNPAAGVTDANLFAWTSLLTNPTASSKVSDFICGNAPFQDVCNRDIYSTMGTAASTLKDFYSVFYDRSIDGANKGFDASGYYWQSDVPVTQICPPGQQGNGYDPKLVVQYARIKIRAVCVTGVGNPCRPKPSFSTYSASMNLCSRSGAPNNSIIVDFIRCISCSDFAAEPGLKPVLVK